jgi:hypothetical protein
VDEVLTCLHLVDPTWRMRKHLMVNEIGEIMSEYEQIHNKLWKMFWNAQSCNDMWWQIILIELCLFEIM